MIIGGDKSETIINIQKNIQAEEYNKKAEPDDPELNDEEVERYLARFEKGRSGRILHEIKKRGAFSIVDVVWLMHRGVTSFEGLENLDKIKGGAIVTCNHFNPIDSIFARAVIRKKFKKTPYIVIQETNLAMPSVEGFLMNNLNMVPLVKAPNYILKQFMPRVKELTAAGEFLQIYPEEEMWFNYRKPRPCKRGSYLFAAQANVPVVPIFVEMIELDKDDNEQFKKLKYVVHVLKPIFPNKKLSDKENSVKMAEKDYVERVECYEKCYGKKIDYKYSKWDIAGLK